MQCEEMKRNRIIGTHARIALRDSRAQDFGGHTAYALKGRGRPEKNQAQGGPPCTYVH